MQRSLPSYFLSTYDFQWPLFYPLCISLIVSFSSFPTLLCKVMNMTASIFMCSQEAHHLQPNFSRSFPPGNSMGLQEFNRVPVPNPHSHAQGFFVCWPHAKCGQFCTRKWNLMYTITLKCLKSPSYHVCSWNKNECPPQTWVLPPKYLIMCW